MKIKTMTVAWLAVAALLLSGCGALGGMLGGGGGSTTANLWSDVPAMDGMTRENIDLPLPIRVAVQAFIQASAGQEGVRVDNFEVVSYTTAKSPDEVKAFYTNERMQAAGWNADGQPGCAGAGEAQITSGTFCLFGKQGASNQSFLVLVASRSENDPKTTLFFVRFDGNVTATPAGN